MDAGFQLEQTDAYAKTRRPVAPQVLDALTDWLDKSLRITNETHG